MNPVLEVFLRTLAVASGVLVAIILGLISLAVLQKCTRIFWKRLDATNRTGVLRKAYKVGLAVLGQASPGSLVADTTTLRDWMQAYLTAQRIGDKVTDADVILIQAQETLPATVSEALQQQFGVS